MAVSPEPETITPEIAAEWLNLNTHNRTLKTREIDEMARDMINGRFVLNGETIKLGHRNGTRKDDTLLDGQNRLHAVIKSGVTIKSIVVRGLSYDETMKTIDSGAKRTGGDIVKLLRGEKHYALLAAIISWAYRQEKRKGRDRGFTCSHSELLDYFDANPLLRDCAEIASEATRRFKPMKGSAFGAAVFHGMSVDEESTREFADQCALGQGLAAGQPAYVLREWLTRATAAARPPVVDAYPAVINKALIAHLEGRELGKLAYRPDHPFPYVQDAEVIEA